jgi:two-component system LytT family response regulator
MTPVLRVVIADDEGPARRFLADLLATLEGVEVRGEAATGQEAVALITALKPNLALLDLQMPELGGLEVVRHLPPEVMPLVAFVTAFDEFAVAAFELNAIDYLLKPVERGRLAATLERARQRLAGGGPDPAGAATRARVEAAHEQIAAGPTEYLDRVPVRHQGDIVFLPTRRIASVVAEGELLHLTMLGGERYTLTHRLHLLESRLDPKRFIRVSRGALVNVDALVRASVMPGGTYLAILSNGQELPVSRTQSRVLRETLMKL